jgi:hypothetical protein
MTMTQQPHLEAFGDPDPDGSDADSDFAGEHQDTAVDPDITAGDEPGEQESPEGWDGLDGDSAP